MSEKQQAKLSGKKLVGKVNRGRAKND